MRYLYSNTSFGYLKIPKLARSHSSITINGKKSNAIVFGGFGFKEKHIEKHCLLYRKFDFSVLPVLSTIKELTTPKIIEKRGRLLAKQLEDINQPLVMHVISGSFWTAIDTLQYMNKDWKEQNVKAIVFDSCPPTSDVHAYGGWLAFVLKRNHLKPYLSPLFYPYIWITGVDKQWTNQFSLKIFGNTSVIPRQANVLFLYGKN